MASATIDGALYLDSSAIVKLVVDEAETAALRAFIGGRAMVSSELVLAEVPRVMERLAVDDQRRRRGNLAVVLDAIDYVPVSRSLLLWAGALEASFLKALDAIHVVSALSVADELGGVVTYDAQQARAVELAALPLAQPGL